MFWLTDEINFHGNILHECNVCFGQTLSVALSSQIKFRNNNDQLQNGTKNIEKPGHSTLSVKVEWVNKFHNRLDRVELWGGFIKMRVTGNPVKWEDLGGCGDIMAGHGPYSCVWTMRMGSGVVPHGMDWAETFAIGQLAAFSGSMRRSASMALERQARYFEGLFLF